MEPTKIVLLEKPRNKTEMIFITDEVDEVVTYVHEHGEFIVPPNCLWVFEYADRWYRVDEFLRRCTVTTVH